MMIVVSDDWRIDADDGLNFTVQERKVAQSGKHAGEETWVNRGYCSSLGDAAAHVLRKGILSAQDVVTVKELAEKIDVATRRIVLACEGGISRAAAVRLKGIAAQIPGSLFEAVP